MHPEESETVNVHFCSGPKTVRVAHRSCMVVDLILFSDEKIYSFLFLWNLEACCLQPVFSFPRLIQRGSLTGLRIL